jgi:hypothetical protein
VKTLDRLAIAMVALTTSCNAPTKMLYATDSADGKYSARVYEIDAPATDPKTLEVQLVNKANGNHKRVFLLDERGGHLSIVWKSNERVQLICESCASDDVLTKAADPFESLSIEYISK